jgi:hypothetical protein
MSSVIIKTLQFPKNYLEHKYGLIHFHFFVQYAKVAGITVELIDCNDRVFISESHLTFSCTVNNDQQIIIDYADHSIRDWKNLYQNVPYFKFQTTIDNLNNFIPLGPPMVGVKRKGTKGATIREYNHIRHHYNYQPGTTILCKQLPNGAAIDRRNLVHSLLNKNFNNVDILAEQDQLDFWKQHETCLTAVCVPGATNNMVDRGHIELIGLGVCTISPDLYTVFPNFSRLESGKHYIKCKDDYSDLIDIIKDLQKNPTVAKIIGDNAKSFYENYYTPTKYWQWISENIQ